MGTTDKPILPYKWYSTLKDFSISNQTILSMSKLTLLPYITVFLILLNSSFPLLVSSAKCHKDDKKALLKLKAGFGKPEDLSWTSDTGCCSWQGVICSALTDRVLALDISSVNLSGTISPSIGYLPFLFDISIQYTPSLTGTIPYSIT